MGKGNKRPRDSTFITRSSVQTSAEDGREFTSAQGIRCSYTLVGAFSVEARQVITVDEIVIGKYFVDVELQAIGASLVDTFQNAIPTCVVGFKKDKAVMEDHPGQRNAYLSQTYYGLSRNTLYMFYEWLDENSHLFVETCLLNANAGSPNYAKKLVINMKGYQINLQNQVFWILCVFEGDAQTAAFGISQVSFRGYVAE